MGLCVYPSKHIHVAVCGPIGTKFGTHMQIHLEKVVGKIKICPCDLGGTWGVLGVSKFGTHMRIPLGTNIGSGLEFDGGTAAICRRAMPTGRNAL